MHRKRPPPLPQAIEKIRSLAKVGAITIARNAQKGIDRLEHDAEDAMCILSECEVHECEKEEPAKYSDHHHVYIFIVELDDESPLYVKVSLNIETLESAELLSYKPDGSPE